MDGSAFPRGGRGRGGAPHDGGGGRGRPLSRNMHWSADAGSRGHTSNNADSGRWERGGHRGGQRGRGQTRGLAPKFGNVSLRLNNPPAPAATVEVVAAEPEPTYEDDGMDNQEDFEEQEVIEEQDDDDDGSGNVIQEPELETAEEREKFYQELVKAREVERKKAIAEGKMDDPLVAKRLEDAISIVGTCMDMCPRFERYRRERENNLFEWETIPGTKRVNHNRAVKMYERAAGDKTLPSDLRPPKVLKRTLNYLFHDLLPRGGFSATFNFIRDRSRSVRNDFTMQHITGPLAIECHDRCARFHILALHFERDRTGFSIPLEEQQLMNTLQSLKEFYDDQRGRYESPTELEMRVYHRLIHIRDQRERHDDIPEHITSHPVFKLTTKFRLHVQKQSAPISKASKLVVTAEGMQIFGQLAATLNEQGSTVMVYLVACILERLFGKDTIDDIESIRGDLSISDIIDGVSTSSHLEELQDEAQDVGEYGEEDVVGDGFDEGYDEQYEEEDVQTQTPAPETVKPNVSEWPSSNFTTQPPPALAGAAPLVPPNAFAGLVAQPNVFGATNVFGTTGNIFGSSVFTTSTTQAAPTSVFGNTSLSSQVAYQGVPFTIASTQKPTPPAVAPFTPTPSPSSNGIGPSAQQPKTPSIFSTPPTNGLGFASSSTPASTKLSSDATLPQQIQPRPSLGDAPPLSNGLAGTSTTCNDSIFFPTPPNLIPSSTLNPKATAFTPPQNSKPPSFFPDWTAAQPNKGSGNITSEPTPPSIFSSIPPFTTTLTNFPTTFTSTPPPTNQTQASPSFFNKPSPSSSGSGSGSATPPTSRLTAPPLLKINTNTSSGSSSSPGVASPRVPPPLSRVQPVSLPSTPTTVLQPPSALLGHLRNTLDSRGSPSTSNTSQEILSPLVIRTPTMSHAKPFHNFTPLSTPQPSRIFRTSPPPPSTNGKGKAPDRSMYDDLEEVEGMKKKALSFAQKSLLVKETFSRWVKRATERAAWLEACRHGDEYRKKLQTQNQNHSRQPSLLRSRHGTPLEKKRRISANGTSSTDLDISPLRKRARKRMSAEYRPPRTDKELAKRFKENHEEHELRWAQGSFLQVIRTHVGNVNSSTLKLPWDIWLSLNPESDATAIWMERKFDMPGSGSWLSEVVFTIPLSSAMGPPLPRYPGMIVFESTPLGDVPDDLEKKYRVLDDCSRLRDIVKAFPDRRHFVPSLLIICWAEREQSSSLSDLFTMAKQLVSESVLQSYEVFAMTAATKDLDIKLESSLRSLNLDTEGKLVRSLTSSGVFKIFEPSFLLFLNEWMENCAVAGRVNWSLYGQVIQASISILNVISQAVHYLLELSSPEEPLLDFDYANLEDSESTYDDVNEWLSSLSSRDDARIIAMDLQSHRNIGQEFPIRIFIERLHEITKTRFECLHPNFVTTHHPVLYSNIKSALAAFKEEVQPHQMKLLQTYNFSVRRSPKRRSYSIATSEQNSPEAKRPRLSESVASSVVEDDHSLSIYMNGDSGDRSVSPTNSTVSMAPTEEAAPVVTTAMLRALTRDLKKKYAVS